MAKSFKYQSFKNPVIEPHIPEQFKELEAAVENSIGEIKEMRKNSLLTCKNLGQPNRHTEDYHFIKTSLIHDFFNSPNSNSEFEQKFTADKILKTHILEFCKNRIVFIDGTYSEDFSSLIDKGIEVVPLEKVLKQETRIKKNLSELVKLEGDNIAAQTRVISPAPLVLKVSQDTAIQNPVQILNFYSNSEKKDLKKNNQSLTLSLGVNSEVSIASANVSEGEINYGQSSRVIDIILDSGSKLNWNEISNLSPTQNFFSKIMVFQDRDSNFTGYGLNRGSNLTRISVQSFLNGQGAHFEWNNAGFIQDERQFHQHLKILHQTSDCTSTQNFKNILKDKARTSVDGTVIVTENSQRTDANQLINNILMSSNCKADNKPNLMIFADDVKCSHGATIGQWDPEQLFYLKSRGLNEQEALSMLTRSFVDSLFENSHPSMKKWFQESLNTFK